MNFYAFWEEHKISVIYLIMFYVIFGIISYNSRARRNLVKLSLFFNTSHLDMPAKTFRQILYIGGLFTSINLMLSFQCNYSTLAMIPIYWKQPQTITELTVRNFQLSGEAAILSSFKENKMVNIIEFPILNHVYYVARYQFTF